MWSTATVTRLETLLEAVREQLLYTEDLDAAPAPRAMASAAARLAVEWEAGMTPAEKARGTTTVRQAGPGSAGGVQG